jgi:hypothetical protein
MRMTKTRKRWAIVSAVVLVLGLGGLIGISGCGGGSESSDMYTTTTAWFPGVASGDVSESSAARDESVSFAPATYSGDKTTQSGAGVSLNSQEVQAGQKIMKTAVLDLEVAKGDFQTKFQKAQQLAGLFGGYVLSSNASVSSDEEQVKSGTVAIRVPVESFDKMMVEARKLDVDADPAYENIVTQDVTSDYVDLKARVTNQQAYVNTMLALLAKAKTIEEILSVQQTLTYAQQELEQLKGQLQYLESNTSYSTLTMNLYETGGRPATPGKWGFVQALKDAMHNVVDAFSAVVRGLGWLIPVIILVAIVGAIIYGVVRSATKKKRQRTKEDVEKTS